MNELLDCYGVVFVCGIGYFFLEIFLEVINVIEEGCGFYLYEQIGLVGKRNIKVKNVWSVNEGVLIMCFYQYNEVSKIESCGE